MFGSATKSWWTLWPSPWCSPSWTWQPLPTTKSSWRNVFMQWINVSGFQAYCKCGRPVISLVFNNIELFKRSLCGRRASTILSLHFPFLRLLYKSLWFQLFIVSLSLNTFLCSHVFDWLGFSVSSTLSPSNTLFQIPLCSKYRIMPKSSTWECSL